MSKDELEKHISNIEFILCFKIRDERWKLDYGPTISREFCCWWKSENGVPPDGWNYISYLKEMAIASQAWNAAKEYYAK